MVGPRVGAGKVQTTPERVIVQEGQGGAMSKDTRSQPEAGLSGPIWDNLNTRIKNNSNRF